MKKLVYNKTGKEVKIGDITETFRGDKVKVTNIFPPHKEGSTGRVYVKDCEDGFTSEFFPGVINASWKEVE